MTSMGDSIRRRRGRPPRAREARTGDGTVGAGAPLRWSRWILGGLGGAALAFGIGYLLAVLVLFPKPALARDEVAVPDLGGMTVDEVRSELRVSQLRIGSVRELVHPTAQPGDVVAQDPLAGQRLRPGAEVHLAVSRGRARVTVPDLSGMPADAGLELAARVGFATERVDEPTLESAGTVLRTEPAAGAQVELPARLRVVVSAGGIEPVDSTPAAPVDSIFEPWPGAESVPGQRQQPGKDTLPPSGGTADDRDPAAGTT